MPSTPQIGRRERRQCPRCSTTMFLERMMPEFGPLPETRRYRCPNCRYAIEEEINREGLLVSAIEFAGLANWLGSRRVPN